MPPTDFPASRRFQRSEASQYLRSTHGVDVAPSTLAKFACTGGGPVFSKFGKHVLYTAAALDAWVAARLSAPTHITTGQRRTAPALAEAA